MSNIIYKEESYKLIGACMEVHRELGSGFLEQVYQEALEIVFKENNIPYIREAELQIMFRGKPLKKKYYSDFLCYNKIIVELKSETELMPRDEAQVFNYLKATNFKLGLLVNFGEPSLNYQRIAY